MTSGVKVTDQVKETINKMKVVKTDADQSERMRLVVFKVLDSNIDVETIYREKDLKDKGSVFKFFRSLLDHKKCCYILYDCHFETTETSKKEDLVFVMWAPDDATITDKMVYSSSQSAIKQVMSGVKHMMQANDLDDCDPGAFLEKLGKNVTCIDGQHVK